MRLTVNKKNRMLFKKTENNKFILKSISKNTHFKTTLVWNSNYFLFKNFYRDSITLLNNCCIFTGKSVSLNLKYKISRMCFLNFSRLNFIHGFKRLSW